MQNFGERLIEVLNKYGLKEEANEISQKLKAMKNN